MLDASSALGELVGYFGRHVPTLGPGLGRALLGAVTLYEACSKLRTRSVWLSTSGYGAPSRPRSERGLLVLLALHTIVAAAFMVGFATLLSGLLLAATLLVVHRKNPHILNGGDAFTQLLVVLIALSPAGASLSLDRWLADGSLGLTDTDSPGAIRLVWVELGVLYLVNAVAKLRNASWRDGSAVGICLANRSFARFSWRPTSALAQWACKLGTWSALLAEIVLGPALLLDPARRGLWLLVGLGLHVGIWITLRVHLFGPVMLAALATMVEPRVVGLVSSEPRALPVDGPHGWACVAYVAVLLAFNLPWPTRALRDLQLRLTSLRLRLGLHRGWTMFSAPPRDVLDVEVVVVTESGSTRASWDPARLLAQPQERRAHVPPDHRVERMKFSLVGDAALQTQLRMRVVEALRQRDDVLAVGVAATREPATGDLAEGGLLPGRVLALVATGNGSWADERAMLSLAATTRSRPLVQAALLHMFDIAARSRAPEDRCRSSRSATLAALYRGPDVPPLEAGFDGDRSVRARWIAAVTTARSRALGPLEDPPRSMAA